MADPLSVTLGVLGLAGLFTTVTEIWSFVDAGRGYSEDFSYLRTRLDNQREIFVQWGRRMEFGSETGYDKRLDEPRMRPRIEATLQHLKLIFSNTDDLVKTCGIKIEEKEVDGVVRTSGSLAIWKPSYERFLTTLRHNQKRVSAVKVTKWSVKDGAKFKAMVDRISELMNDLNELTKGFTPESRHAEIALDEANTIDDINQLAEVQRAIPQEAGYAETVISSAATGRRHAIEAGFAETINSSIDIPRSIASGAESDPDACLIDTFHTGKTHQANLIVGGVIAEDCLPLDANEMEDQVEEMGECVICCVDMREQDGFFRLPTSLCKHGSAVCYSCLRDSIRFNIQREESDQPCCPICRAKLSDSDILFFSSSDTMILYKNKKKRKDVSDRDTKEPQPSTNTNPEVLCEWGTGIGLPLVKCRRCGWPVVKGTSDRENMTCERCQGLEIPASSWSWGKRHVSPK